VIVGAVGAAALACSGVAPAASVVRGPGPGTSVVASQPTTVAKYIGPNHVGSAGIAGLDDARCQAIVNAHNEDEQSALEGIKTGDQNHALGSAELADGSRRSWGTTASSSTDRAHRYTPLITAESPAVQAGLSA